MTGNQRAPATERMATIIKLDPIKVDAETDLSEAWYVAERPVRRMFKSIEAQCKANEQAWSDPDFGPNERDPTGSTSFYVDGFAPPGYAEPDKCHWARPVYDGQTGAGEQNEDLQDLLGPATDKQAFCGNGMLFRDGADSNDVVQGRLGDCWFLGALSVLATRTDLLRRTLWGMDEPNREKTMRRYGFRVCRYFKDAHWYYVFIDDKLPVFESGKPVFAHCRDVNELWVPFLEKAYAKLHGSYDALIGGYIDGALKDLTGLIAEEAVLRKGHMGYNKVFTDMQNSGSLWEKLDRYANYWGCLMGCSIQPDPPTPGHPLPPVVSEQEIPGTGLRMKHAYALVDVGEITTVRGEQVKLVRLRNPWGYGEWTGPWSDESQEFQANISRIAKEFSGPVRRMDKTHVKANMTTAEQASSETVSASKDGTFFMTWADWCKYFTVFFAAVDFPDDWSGLRASGEWRSQSSGGNNTKRTWAANPRIRFRIPRADTLLFVSICQDDPRLVHGKEQWRFQDALGFHIVKDPKGGPINPPKRQDMIPGGSFENTPLMQPAYKMHLSNDMYVTMAAGDYVLVPSTYEAQKPGKFFLSVYSDKRIAVEGAELIAEEEEQDGKHLQLTFDDKKPAAPNARELREAREFEQARDELLEELYNHGVNIRQVKNRFKADALSSARIDWKQWSTRFRDLGLPAHVLTKAKFEIFAGEDGLVDADELNMVFDAELNKASIFGDTVLITGKSSALSGSSSLTSLVSRGGITLGRRDGGGGGDEALPMFGGGGDQFGAKSRRGSLAMENEWADSAAVGSGTATIGMDHPIVSLVQDVMVENMAMKREMVAIKEEQARMMHVLLLYGKMLKCYDGPVYDPAALATSVIDQRGNNRNGAMADGDLSPRSKLAKAFSGYTNMSQQTRGPSFGGGQQVIPQPQLRRRASNAGSSQGRRFSLVELEAAGTFEQTMSFKEYLMMGDEFMAIKPWKGTVKPPTNPPPVDSSAPTARLALEWVHGYAAQTSRNNIGLNASGEVVYHAAGFGIVLNAQAHTQTYNDSHTDDITCLAMTTDRKLVVTGQLGKDPLLTVWDAASGQVRCTLRGAHKRGVPSVAFGSDGKTILSVGDDDDHTVVLWGSSSGSWTDGKMLSTSKGNKSACLFACAVDGPEHPAFVVGSSKQVMLWTAPAPGSNKLKGKNGKYGSQAINAQPCGAPIGEGFFCTGGTDGSVLLWQLDRCVFGIKAHEGCVSAMSAVGSGQVLSGGSDGAVKLWTMSDKQVNLACEFNLASLPAAIKSTQADVRAMSWDTKSGKLVLGTRASELYVMNNVTQDRFSEAPANASVVMQGHYQHELWGLCAHPTNPDLFVTTGDDRTMRTWSASSRKQVQMASLPDLSRAVDWSPDGSFLALGLGGRVGGILRATSKEGKRLKAGTGGGVVVLNSSDLSVVKAIKPASNKIKKWVSEVKFAPDGNRVAVGGHDSQIHIFDTRTLKRAQVLKKSSASITHVDWSADGLHLQSNDMSYELLYYNSKTGAQVTTPLKDETWRTWTCTLGWPVQGVWPAESDGTDVNSVDRSADGKLLATGDDFSSVKLFRYPCVEPKSEYTVGKGHASHVTNVRFSCDGKRLFTTGGNDRCVMQWRVEDA